ncbi:MAG: phasin family protein [Candidatus Competibacteraceae bacterium]
MIIEMFAKSLESPQSLPEWLIKANKLLVEELEQVFAFQMGVLHSYLNMSLNQLKAAAEITDTQSLHDFYTRQAEIASFLQQKSIKDTKVITDMATRFKAEFDNLIQATLDEVLPKAA